MNYHIYAEGDFSRIEAALAGVVESDIDLAAELVFADEAEIRAVNLAQRGVDAVTDVLSFPTLDGIRGKALKRAEHPFDIDEEGNLFLGSILLCKERARAQAEEYGHSYERELCYLIVHAAMHLFGYDHMTEEDKAEMRQKEEAVLASLGVSR